MLVFGLNPRAGGWYSCPSHILMTEQQLLGQIANNNGERGMIGSANPTCAVLINHRQLLPFEERHHVQDGPGNGGVLRIQVDEEGVLVVHRGVFPAGLDVRDLQGVADGLDGADRGAVRGPEHGDDPEGQLVTHWRQNNKVGFECMFV